MTKASDEFRKERNKGLVSLATSEVVRDAVVEGAKQEAANQAQQWGSDA
jgi:hypothetical protein